MHKKHGMTGTRLNNIYKQMKSRCYNKNNKRYYDYGGRGIKICKDWLDDFMSFYNWAMDNGYTSEFSIERIDNNLGYSPDNCK